MALDKYIHEYILILMEKRAKLFQNGGSQAVRLPKECRFPDGEREVVVRREGRTVVLESVDEWSDGFRACLGAWSEGIPRPEQPAIADAPDPFS